MKLHHINTGTPEYRHAKNHHERIIAISFIAACAVIQWAGVLFNAQAQAETSALSAVSALPMSFVVIGASAVAGGAAQGEVPP